MSYQIQPGNFTFSIRDSKGYSFIISIPTDEVSLETLKEFLPIYEDAVKSAIKKKNAAAKPSPEPKGVG